MGKVATNKVIMFAKIQLLEGAARKELLMNSPLKRVYVFSKRVSPLNNGLDHDEKGKPWATTMCFAWFVWEHGYFSANDRRSLSKVTTQSHEARRWPL